MKNRKLYDAVQNISGASFLGLTTLTDVKLTGGKSNPHQGRVQKRMLNASVMAFQNKTVNGYEAMIKRRLESEGKDPTTFTVGERAWGVRVPNLPLVAHAKEGDTDITYYLEVIFLKPGKIEYLIDGQPADTTAMAAVTGMPGKKDDDEGQGGLENKVVIRAFKSESIESITIDGKVFA